jgi:hypothetical protein
MIFKKFGKFILIFIISFSWIFSGWPQVLIFPQKIKEANAATISFVSNACASSDDGLGTYTLTLPTTLENDLVVVAIGTGDNDNVNEDVGPNLVGTYGYTEVADLFSNDTFDTNLGVFWKVMGATPDTSYTLDSIGGNDASNAAVCIVFRGVDTTTPMDVTPTTATGLNIFSPNPPSINHNNPSGVWAIIAGASSHNLGDTGNFTFPTGYTTNTIIRGHNDTNDVTVGMGYRSSGVSDPEDPGVMTHSGTNSTSFAWGAVTIALRPALDPTFEQSAYRFFNNVNSTDVGTTLAAQDTPATLVNPGDAFRLRTLLHVGASQLGSLGESFKLQFATKSGICDTAFSGETYADVTGATAIAYSTANTPPDGDALTSNANDPTHSGHTIVNQDYEEANNFTNSIAAIPAGQDGKWDFSLIDNGAPASTSYCFRVRKSDDTNINTYTVIPEITTSSGIAPPSLTFSISDNSIGFGTLTAADDFFANGAGTGSATEVEAHTISASTNATSGYSITINGATLTYGGNTINAIGASNTASSPGTEQFGLRMTASGGDGAVSAPYAASGFAFDTASFPDLVASDANGDDITTTYSVRYLGNISTTTEAGAYNAVLTYVITASF